nr:RNA-directed DNA polymerase, eukaryota, reverse transcriptase zinc-binding domain protein [Tanacetum cinerariifolium]
MKTSGSILSELAKRVKNIDGKVLGKDGKPLKAYHFVTFGENNKDTSVTTFKVDYGIHARNIDDVVEVRNPSKATATHVISPTVAHVNRQNTFRFCFSLLDKHARFCIQWLNIVPTDDGSVDSKNLLDRFSNSKRRVFYYDVLDSPCLLVFITGTSQSRQHDKSE